MSTATEIATLLEERAGWITAFFARAVCPRDSRCWYHAPTLVSRMMARRAARVNQMMLCCPRGRTINAASRGSSDEPTFPPTWNTDCARPCCPPDAILATRDDSG